MKVGQNQRKISASKTKKAITGQYIAGSSSGSRRTKTTVKAYKPGSVLARNGGMVPTVELSKNAAKKIS